MEPIKLSITHHAIYRFCERIMELKPPFNTWEVYLAKLLIKDEISSMSFPIGFDSYEIHMKTFKAKMVIENGFIVTFKNTNKTKKRTK